MGYLHQGTFMLPMRAGEHNRSLIRWIVFTLSFGYRGENVIRW